MRADATRFVVKRVEKRVGARVGGGDAPQVAEKRGGVQARISCMVEVRWDAPEIYLGIL